MIVNKILSHPNIKNNFLKFYSSYKKFKEINKINNELIKSDIIQLIDKNEIIKNKINITKDIKILLSIIKNKSAFKKFEPVLENFTKNIDKIDLKQNIKNSGIFFENKLKNNILQNKPIETELKNDLKKNLYEIKNKTLKRGDKNIILIVDKIIKNINFVQMNSFLNQAFISYIPFSWNKLKDGKMKFDSSNNKKTFSCKIELNLEKYGEIFIHLLMHSNELSIGINTKNNHFKKLAKSSFNLLNTNLKEIGLNTNIFFFKEKKQYYNNKKITNLGMDFKI